MHYRITINPNAKKSSSVMTNTTGMSRCHVPGAETAMIRSALMVPAACLDLAEKHRNLRKISGGIGSGAQWSVTAGSHPLTRCWPYHA